MERLTNLHHYNNYKAKVKSPVSYEKYNNFLYGNGESLFDWRTMKPCSEMGLMQHMLHLIVTKGAIISIPYNLGKLYITKKKSKVYQAPDGKYYKKRVIDWAATKGTNKVTFLDNTVSDDYVYKIKWNVTSNIFKNKSYYKFKPSRGFQRYIKYMKDLNPQLDFLEDV